MNRGTCGWQRRRIYNFKFWQCRVVVEQCFGRMKNRWRILRFGLEFRDLQRSGLAIATMAALQNFLLRNGDNDDVSYNSTCLWHTSQWCHWTSLDIKKNSEVFNIFFFFRYSTEKERFTGKTTTVIAIRMTILMMAETTLYRPAKEYWIHFLIIFSIDCIWDSNFFFLLKKLNKSFYMDKKKFLKKNL